MVSCCWLLLFDKEEGVEGVAFGCGGEERGFCSAIDEGGSAVPCLSRYGIWTS